MLALHCLTVFTVTANHCCQTLHTYIHICISIYFHFQHVHYDIHLYSQVTGPILVQVGPPVFSGNIAVSVQEHDGSKYLVGRWDRAGFSARDLQDALIYRYSYAVGKYLVGRWDRACFSARDLQDALIYRYSYGVGKRLLVMKVYFLFLCQYSHCDQMAVCPSRIRLLN